MQSALEPSNVEISRRTASARETRALGRRLARALSPLPVGGMVLALHGDLGAGKTVFVQGLARGLGVPEDVPVVSPTFTIARSYRPARSGADPAVRATLHHVDAYRLRGADDLEHAGFEEMRGEGCVTCVEWGERVEDVLPEDRIDVFLEIVPGAKPPAPGDPAPGDRLVRLLARGPAGRDVLERLGAGGSEPS